MYILVKTCTEYLNREWCIIEWVRSVISNECWIMNFIYVVVVFPFGWVLLVKQPIPMSEYSSQYGSCVSKLVIPWSAVSYRVLVCVVESMFRVVLGGQAISVMTCMLFDGQALCNTLCKNDVVFPSCGLCSITIYSVFGISSNRHKMISIFMYRNSRLYLVVFISTLLCFLLTY